MSKKPEIEIIDSVPDTKKKGGGMYVVKRKEGEGIVIGGVIEIFVKEIKESNVLMAFKCPSNIKIERLSR